MLKRKDLRNYQEHGVKHVMKHKGSGLFYDMGCGKSIVSLTALDQLLYESFAVEKPLIIAPKLVAEHTWSDEIDNWAHTNHLKLVKILGTEKQRKAALKTKGDIWVINRENVTWLQAHYGLAWPFDMVVIDELSSFKNPDSQRFRSLRAIRPKIRRVVGLTGTPAPNGFLDLWSQVYLLDQGERLGKSFEGYRARYFEMNPHSGRYEIIMNPGEKRIKGQLSYYEKKIVSKISDICISLKKEDWIEMPERIDITKYAHLPTNIQDQYEDFEKEMVLKLLEEDGEVNVTNSQALITKLLQFANGAVYYDDEKNFYEVHSQKLELLGEEVEATNGVPILVSYQFQHDIARIKKHLKAFKPQHIHDLKNPVADWNAGKVRVMLGHAASMGHGLNLQFGGQYITHYGVGWPLELYQQVVDRIHRPGVASAVTNSRLITKGTYEERVLARLEGKADRQETMLQAVKAIVSKYK
ncbi:DEAD/DEAH box helicase [Niabella terrae]